MVVLSLSTQDDTKNKGYFGDILKGVPKMSSMNELSDPR